MAHLDLQTGSYAAAETLLGSRDSRRIGHNTRLHRQYGYGPDNGGYIAVQYHATDIVTLTADGWLTLNTGGWSTVTTWQRINALLPGRWAVHSDRGNRSLYHGGRAITPYADGLSIHAVMGEVGMNSVTLLTALDVANIEVAAEAADAVRAEKRVARLLREHPAVNAPRSHRGYDHRAYGCDRCDVELAAEREADKRRLAAEHAALGATLARNPDDADPWTEAENLAAGSHIRRDTWGGGVHIACPWTCPDRTDNY